MWSPPKTIAPRQGFQLDPSATRILVAPALPPQPPPVCSCPLLPPSLARCCSCCKRPCAPHLSDGKTCDCKRRNITPPQRLQPQRHARMTPPHARCLRRRAGQPHLAAAAHALRCRHALLSLFDCNTRLCPVEACDLTCRRARAVHKSHPCGSSWLQHEQLEATPCSSARAVACLDAP